MKDDSRIRFDRAIKRQQRERYFDNMRLFEDVVGNAGSSGHLILFRFRGRVLLTI